MVDLDAIHRNLQGLRDRSLKELKKRGIDTSNIPRKVPGPITCLPNSIAINGKNYSAFDRIPVKSLVQRSDSRMGGVIIKRGGPAELLVLPVPAGRKPQYFMVPVGGRIACEMEPIEHKHFEFI